MLDSTKMHVDPLMWLTAGGQASPEAAALPARTAHRAAAERSQPPKGGHPCHTCQRGECPILTANILALTCIMISMYVDSQWLLNCNKESICPAAANGIKHGVMRAQRL